MEDFKRFLGIIWEILPELLSKIGIVWIITIMFKAPIPDNMLLKMILGLLFFWFGFSLWEKKN
jgi:hypothetical protein